jgi:hypothetical protein
MARRFAGSGFATRMSRIEARRTGRGSAVRTASINGSSSKRSARRPNG